MREIVSYVTARPGSPDATLPPDALSGPVVTVARALLGRDLVSRVDGASVRVLEVQRAVGEEAGVGVAAAVGADERGEVGGPAHPHRVDAPLDAGLADADDVDLYRPEGLVLGTVDRREDRRVVLHG